MTIKKRITLFLAAVMALAILVTGMTFTVFAEETENLAFKVEHADGTVTEYAPEGDESLTAEARAGNAFVAAITNAKAGDKITALNDFDIPSGDHKLSVNATIDLGGKTVTTSGRIVVQPMVELSVLNGTIDKTAKEFIYMGEYGAGVSETTLELKDIVAKKEGNAANTALIDVRAGNVIFDNVTVNDGEYSNDPKASHISMIHAGYRTRTLDQAINIEVKNSNIRTRGTSFITALGTSNQGENMGGYVLNVAITDSVVAVDHYILLSSASADVAGKSGINITATGNTTLTSDIPVIIPDTFTHEKVNIMIGYGVTTKKPKPDVGTVTLGEDGNGVLDLRTLSDTKNIGIVRDLWADDYTPVTDSAYSFVVVGDTQMTVDFDPENLHYIYDWILDNKETKNIKYVFGMGDITNNSTDVEWATAYEQIIRLDGKVPYSLIRGNHDTSGGYNATFNNEVYKSMFEGFYPEDKIENSYVTFTVGDTKYLHITLDLNPSNTVLNWASSIIERYYDHLVIISTHSYLNNDGNLHTDGASDDGSENSGEQMWNKLVSKYENVFLVLCGHRFMTDIVYRQATGVHGNTVTEIMTNGQCIDLKNDAMGLVSILNFSEDGKNLTVEYYSTVYDRYFGKNSQFTLSIPEYNPDNYEAPNFLYEVTDANGVTITLSDERTPSLIFSSLESGSTVKLLGDIVLNSNTTITNNLTIDLNGHSITTSGRFNVNSSFTVKNGTIIIDAKELVYVEVGNTKANLTFTNVDLIHTSTAVKKPLAEIRDGAVTLDNVRSTAEDWNGTHGVIIAGARTKKTGQNLYITIQNSVIDLGSSGCPVISLPGTSGETKGYTGNVTIINSTITTSGKLLSAKPSTESAANCAINASIDENSVINCGTVFTITGIDTDKINVSIATGARFTSIPKINGVSFDGADVFIYNSTDELLYAAKLAEVDTSVAGCKLVSADGELVCLWNGTVINKDLLSYAQNAACDIVLLGDMTTPAGASSSSRYSMTVTISDLTIDLNGHNLNMGAWCYFGTASDSKVLTIKNGTVNHSYTVFYSYSGSKTSGFTAIGVKFVMSGHNAMFDHRMGILTLTDCEIKNTNTSTSNKYIFVLGNTTRKDSVVVNISGCTILANTTKSNVFETFSGQPCTVNVEDTTITSVGRIIYAPDSQGKNPADVFNFTNCTISTTIEGSLFNLKYDNFTINLDEVYVPTGNDYESTTGTVNIAKGQTKATVEGGGYKITAPKITPQINLTLYTDFVVNLWLPVDETSTKVMVDGVEYQLAEAEQLDGKYWIQLPGIGASTAADDFDIYITYVDGDLTLTAVMNYSIIKYADAILSSSEYSAEIKSLLVYVLQYIEGVYNYISKEVPASLSELMASDEYIAATSYESTDGVTSVPQTETDTGTANNAIVSGSLLLDESVHFVLKLNSDYTGPVTLRYQQTEQTYDVSGGLVDGLDYILVNLRAYSLYDEVINIIAGEYQGSYDLAAYINGVSGESDTLSEMLLALYNYCKEADEYRDYVASGGRLN